ncbi:hypothetical protein FHQ18_01780 [Deferribacter autotrophicus]|uniref:Nuclear transport factor 2 family protein n=1 Tax=Deferribacter autotrophicus TaxID=500465 RepID=A0A5A8F8T0_9BACT|nr:hypothetical protein [Deferribacter autotrophicus]KAA0259206.1 hypothetical protein FHQ18_01780 [Deferribacter autotrophicus]
MRPAEIIIYRQKLLEEKRFQDIYELYDDSSLFKQMHPSLTDYITFMNNFSKQIKIEKIQILDENIKSSLSKVTFFEYILDDQEKIVQFCTTYMKQIKGSWKIIKETREQIDFNDKNS